MLVIGASIAAGGCATAHHHATAMQTGTSWSCPSGTYPDRAKSAPNCDSRSPWAPGGEQALNQPAKAGAPSNIRWSCPAGTAPDTNQATPNCLLHVSELSAQRAQLDEEKAHLAMEQQKLREQQQQAKAGEEKAPETGTIGTAAPAEPAVEKRVEFASASAKLTDSSKATLDEFATAVQKESPIETIRIEGNTDNTGSTEANDKLAEKRAEAGKSYLEEKGLPSDKIEAKAQGDAEPIATNDSAAGRKMNRNALIVAMK